ncbi:aldo/keto reductase [Actinomadura parmotrematis]|uniref:Aldo/keto reductase n=1 Tax=Actinomadura parmotrematis TaxID=2864039 RepID=A0ABS7G4P7_9ACTN|nr:aldo/keto reductase [Actinomadura parmotrematis]MBW8487702.1 aldo/keto reductase [Actinomadura parmotrematis]
MGTGGARVLYGCMGLGDVGQAQAAVRAALDAGITAFDHADIYGGGRAEAVFGEVLAGDAGLRERITVQTKCGIRPDLGVYDLRGASITARVEQSLERLRTDVVDVLLLHRPDPLADPADVAAALTSLHRQGLVRAFGVSNMSGAQIALLQHHLELPLVADQLEMSLHRRDWVEAGVLVDTPESAEVGFPLGTVEYCMRHGVELQAWGALAQGRYTGREQNPTAELVARLAAAKGTTPETIVLWWLQRHPARIAPVIGTTNPDRIRACADAARREPDLTREEWYELWLSARGHRLP